MTLNSDSTGVSEVSEKIKKISSTINEGQLAAKGKYFGEQYIRVGGYTQAIEWICKYLRNNDRDPAALKLLGDCYLNLEIPEKALVYYQKSYSVNSNQNDLLVKIVELYLQPGSAQNKNKAELWLGKVPKALQGNEKVFELKMELMKMQNAPKSLVKKAVLEEMIRRPRELALHVRFVKLLKECDSDEAVYDYCNKKENFQAPTLLIEDPEWCTCVADAYEIYSSNPEDIENGFMIYQLMGIEALSRAVSGYLWQGKHKEAFDTFFMMDKRLFFLNEVCSSYGAWVVVHKEMVARLCCQAATLLLHLSNTGKVSSSDCINYCSVLYALSSETPLPSLTSSWAVSCQKPYPRLPARMRVSGGERVSECNHMLLLLAQRAGDSFATTITDVNLLEKSGTAIYDLLCQSSEKESEASFLYNHLRPQLKEEVLPDITSMYDVDDVATGDKSLQLIIWLGVRWLELQDDSHRYLPWTKQVFPELKMVADTDRAIGKSLTLGVLDVEAFIAACVFTTFKKVDMWKKTGGGDVLSIPQLPHLLCRRLFTDMQQKWWDVAKRVQLKNSLNAFEIAKLKPILIRGIESLRCIGNHGLEITLVVKLAQYFQSKASDLRSTSGQTRAWLHYQQRANLYWLAASPELKELTEDRQALAPASTAKDMLLPHVFDAPSAEEAKTLLSSAYECQGDLAEYEGHTDIALSFYSKASTATASYSRAKLYKSLADETNKKGVGDYMVELDKKVEGYMKQHRNCLEMTMLRLQDAPNDNLHEQTIKQLVGLSTKDKLMSDSKVASTPDSKKKETAKEKTSPFPAVAEREAMRDQLDSLTSAINGLKLEMAEMRRQHRESSFHLHTNTPNKSSTAQNNNLEFSAIANSSEQQQPPAPSQQAHLPPHMQHSTPNVNYFNQHPPRFPPQPHQQYFSPQPGGSAGGFYQSPQPHMAMPPVNHPLYQQQYGVPPPQPFTPQPFNQQPQPFSQQPHGQQFAPQFGGQQGPPQYAMTPPMAGNRMPYQQMPPQQPGMFPHIAVTPQRPEPPLRVQPTSILADSVQNTNAEELKRRLTASFNTPPQLQQPAQQSNNIEESYIDNNEYITCEDIAKYLDETEYQECGGETSNNNNDNSIVNNFLSKFNPTTSGSTMTFQSPEQMDKENQELKQREAGDDRDEERAAFDALSPEFKRTQPVPDEVEVATGEEDERVGFVERCKLFRWDDGQWKDRGIGEMKLLVHNKTDKCRLLMRREQVLKVCCNHIVTSSVHLTPMANNDKAMIWHAMDFADDEERSEKFAVKFKTSDIATRFQTVVNGIAQGGKPPQGSVTSSATTAGGKDEQKKEAEPKVVAAAVEKPTVVQAPAAPSSSKLPPAPIASVKEAEDEEGEEKKVSMFSGLAAALQKNSSTTKQPVFSLFGSSSAAAAKPLSFGALAATSKPAFSLVPPASSASLEQSKQAEEKKGDEDEGCVVGEEGPVIERAENLPDLVEVKSGEEDEQVMFDERAKLFRYVGGEWKERGLGQMKILKHNTKSTYRILMRREQVMKPCANHLITKQLTLQPYGAKNSAWTWTSVDFAEIDGEESTNDGKPQIFAVRFKTPEIAQQFKKQFESGQKDDSDKKTEEKIEVTKTTASSEKKSPCDGLLKQLLTKPESVGLAPAPSAAKAASAKWICDVCMVKNKATDLKCPCCSSPNPNAPAQQPATSAQLGGGGGSGFTFGAPSAQDSSKPTFGAPAAAPTFGASAAAPTFGAPAAAPTFGTSVAAPTFGAPAAEAGSLFGSKSSAAPTFGAPTAAPKSATGGLFGSKVAGSNESAIKTTSLFGAPPAQAAGLFGTPAKPSAGLFGASPQQQQAASSLFGTPQQAQPFDSCKSLFNPTQSAPLTFSTAASASQQETAKSAQPFNPFDGSNQAVGLPKFDVTPNNSSDDSDDSDENTSDSYSVEDNEIEAISSEDEVQPGDGGTKQYKSPLLRNKTVAAAALSVSAGKSSPSKHSSTQKSDGGDDDVIYVGEELPSKELQDKAKQLLLPAHFFNYLGKDDSNDTDEDDEEYFPDTKDYTKPTVFGTFKEKSPMMPSFQTLAARCSEGGFNFNISHGVKPVKPNMKKSSPVKSKNSPKKSDETTSLNNSYDPQQEVQIEGKNDLPPVVRLTYDEEKEKTLFSERAKLFRWAPSTREWKERGVGEITIKQNKQLNKFRILMRRDQVLKVCANHYISCGMKLQESTFPTNRDKTWIWLAHDYADEGAEATVEKFAVRFKTAEHAQAFSELFTECVVLSQDEVLASDSFTTIGSTFGVEQTLSSTSTLIDQAEKMKNELAFFRDKFSEPSKVDLENTFTEGLSNTPSVSSRPQQSIVSGAPIQLTPMVQRHMEDKRKQMTGSPHHMLEWDNYDLQAKTSANNSTSPHQSVQSPSQIAAHNVSNQSDEACERRINSSFTGEEDDVLLFQMRVKLFLFDREGKQWKDRGIGNVRLLQNNTSCKPRLVMRREQVLKVCLNQYVSSEVKFANFNNSHNAIVWTNMDFSDEEKSDGEMLQFAMKFKTEQLKNEFLKIVESARQAESEEKVAQPSAYLAEQKGGNEEKSEEANEAAPATNFNFNSPMSFNFGFGASSNTTAQPSPFALAGQQNQTEQSPVVSSSLIRQPVFTSPLSSATTSSSTHQQQTSTPAFKLPHPSANTAAQNIFANADSADESTSNSSSSDDEEYDDDDENYYDDGYNQHHAGGAGDVYQQHQQSDDDDDDVVFVWRAEPTQEQRARAENLQLPPTFYITPDQASDPGDALTIEEERIMDFIRLRDDSRQWDTSISSACNIAVTPAGSCASFQSQPPLPSNAFLSTASPNPADSSPNATRSESEKQEDEASEKQPLVSAAVPSSGFAGLAAATSSAWSFSSVAQSDAAGKFAFGSRKDDAFNVSAQASMLFTNQSSNADGDNDDDVQREQTWQAREDLPPIVETKTGEENDEVIFKERAKLFRFDQGTGQWKERGVGDYKILYNPDYKVYRVVMRRDQVLKVCANHILDPSMKLMANGEKAWMYVASDRSDGEEQIEKLTVRFKTIEIAQNLREKWNECQQLARENS